MVVVIVGVLYALLALEHEVDSGRENDRNNGTYIGPRIRFPMPSAQSNEARAEAVAGALDGQSFDAYRIWRDALSELSVAQEQAKAYAEVEGRDIEGDLDGQILSGDRRKGADLQPSESSPTSVETVTRDGKRYDETFIATRYGESYNGQTVGCSGYGVYNSNDASILAAPPARYTEWPCGTIIRVCTGEPSDAGISTDNAAEVGRDTQEGKASDGNEWSQAIQLGLLRVYESGVRCLFVRRVDSCPGCGSRHIDLSESGLYGLCGYTGCGRIEGLVIEVVGREVR